MLRKFWGPWDGCPLFSALSESDTQLTAEPRQPYGHALMGVRVLKFDGAIAPRVLKFDSGPAAEGCGGRVTFIEGASLYKTFTIGLLPVGKPYNRHAGEEMQSPFGGWRHHLSPASGGTITRAYCRAAYEARLRGVLFCPLHRGKSGEAG